MIKILGVMGSPRKNGNTDILISHILEGSEKAGAETEIIYLGDYTIKECDGCHICWEGKACPKNDDMNNLYGKIAESDVIIFGTPVYWYGPTGLMKMFIDRFVFFNCPENRKKIKGKKAVIAVPFEEENLETAKQVELLFEKSFKYLEMNFIGKLIVGGVSAKGDILKKEYCLKEAFELGKKLVSQN